MIYLIWGVLGVLSIINRNSKFITFLLFLFITCVFCFNTENPDLASYIDQYNAVPWSFTEPIFVSLGITFRNAGLSFEVYRFFWVLVCLSLTISTIYRFSPYPTFVLFLYSIYPMTIDVVQIRFFIGYTIVLFAIRFLIDYQTEKKIKYVFLYFFFLLVATCCHYGCIFYAILGLLFLDLDKHKFFYFVVFPFLVVISLFFIQKIAFVVAPLLGSYKGASVFTRMHYPSVYGLLRVLVTRPIPLFFVLFLSCVSRNSSFNKIYGVDLKKSMNFFSKESISNRVLLQPFNKFYDLDTNKCLFRCMYFVAILLVMEIVAGGDYERLGRLTLLLSAILISRQMFYLNSTNALIASFLVIIMFIVYFISIMFFGQDATGNLYIDTVFKAVMNNNSFF